MIQSQFRVWFVVMLSAIFLVTVSLFFYNLFTLGKDVPGFRVGGHPSSPVGRVVGLLGSLFIALLSFAELRERALRIQLDCEDIIAQNFLGLGRSKYYPLSGFVGFTTTKMQTKLGEFEVLNLLLPNDRTIELSAFCHSNFLELKAYVEGHLQNLGTRPYKDFAALKNLFH